MKLFADYFQSMYVLAIFLLLLVAIAASFTLKIFPMALFVAIAACSLLDVFVAVLFLRRALRFPYSAFISGIIIGSIAPFDAPVPAILVASAVAILSKHIIRIKGRHIFNPAALGLIVSLYLFNLGEQWWAAIGFAVLGVTLPITLILIAANYKAEKLKVSIPFLFVTAFLYLSTGFVSLSSVNPTGVLAFVNSLPFYFAFIMLSEPKTSPYKPQEQIIFGFSLAFLYFALDFNRVRFPFFIALLAGNLAYSAYRNFLKKYINNLAGIIPYG